MERKQHIEMMRRIGAILDGKNLPDAAKQPAISYARRLATDAALQASVRQSFKSDLAERDLKRASKVVEKYCKTNEREPVKPAAVMSPPKPTHTPEELLDFANMKRIPHGDFRRLLKNGQWTAVGRAAFLAGQPSVEARTETAVKPVTPTPIESSPVLNRNPLLVERPYEETEAGYDALQAYWDEHKQMPSEGFDLKAWYTSVLAAWRCARRHG